MAEVIPFKGVLFNVSKASKSSGEELLAPPYDIISPEQQQVLYDKSPYNIVRIDFGKKSPDDNDQSNRYSRAQASLDAWFREEALVTSSTPNYYAYEVAYSIEVLTARDWPFGPAASMLLLILTLLFTLYYTGRAGFGEEILV